MVKDLLNSNKITEAVAKTIRHHTGKSQNTSLEGKDLLHEQVIQKLIYKAVEKDQWIAPFKLVGTEMKVSTELQFNKDKSVKLEGTLDRVHQMNEVTHIIDYKTGRADIMNQGFRNDISGYLNVHFEEPKYKSGFQSFFYGYLWSRKHQDPVKLGVYPLKKVNEGIKWLYYSRIIPSEAFEVFENRLMETLNELFDETVPFKQTDEVDRCRWCAYKDICQR